VAGQGSAPSGIDTRIPNVARMYDYALGGKDNISQVVSPIPYSHPTAAVQGRQAHYSKTESSAVRSLSAPCLGAYVRFDGRVFLTLS
jgi:S-adenosyl methyltransferase